MIRYWLTTIILVSSLFASLALAGNYQPSPGTNQIGIIRYEWHDPSRDRDVPVKIYYPKTGDGPFPVIIFSHGLGGSREGYAYLGEDWAAHGYVSVHLQHHGSDQGIFKNGSWLHLEETLHAAIENPTNSIDRAHDVSFAIDQLEKLNHEPLFQNRLDLSHIGMAGHSFGAATTLVVSGERGPHFENGLSDPRVKASIAMSPPLFSGLRFDAIRIPVFVMTGTEDAGFTRSTDRRTAFDKISSPGTCLVNFDGANHMTFSDRLQPGQAAKGKKFHPLILAATNAYWDAHLRDNADAREWLEQGGFAAILKDGGKFELK